MQAARNQVESNDEVRRWLSVSSAPEIPPVAWLRVFKIFTWVKNLLFWQLCILWTKCRVFARYCLYKRPECWDGNILESSQVVSGVGRGDLVVCWLMFYVTLIQPINNTPRNSYQGRTALRFIWRVPRPRCVGGFLVVWPAGEWSAVGGAGDDLILLIRFKTWKTWTWRTISG